MGNGSIPLLPHPPYHPLPDPLILLEKQTDSKKPTGWFLSVFVGFWCLYVLVMPRRGEAVCPVFLQCASVRPEEGAE